ncbi:unnamed protein product [Symbiodinium microadriaticum]|nr:unnamed protein product [Symbiodinium microadriaticum]
MLGAGKGDGKGKSGKGKEGKGKNGKEGNGKEGKGKKGKGPGKGLPNPEEVERLVDDAMNQPDEIFEDALREEPDFRACFQFYGVVEGCLVSATLGSDSGWQK